ncbi:MAG: hypothetical protein ACJAXK_001361 [Yoonia sp.]|jgi:hypothetical protein
MAFALTNEIKGSAAIVIVQSGKTGCDLDASFVGNGT